ncbi:carotenoid biosynthesis protein [Actinomycetes bacterium M1A6_2h]
MTPGRIPAAFAIGAVLAQITYPLVSGSARDVVTFAVVALLAAACLAHAVQTRGAGWALALLVVTAGVGLVAEIIGSTTGYPFGDYAYAQGRIGPSIQGVPLVVPFAWTVGLYPAWCVATELTPRRLPRIALVVAGLVGWDFYLDPQMVLDGQWTWFSDAAQLPGLPDIPYTNFLGWVLVALVMAGGMELLGRAPARTTAYPAVPVALFLWTWLGSALAHAVFLPGLGWSAVYGLVAMGVVGVPLLLSLRYRVCHDLHSRDDRAGSSPSSL